MGTPNFGLEAGSVSMIIVSCYFIGLFVHDEIYFVVNYSSSRVDVVCMYVCVCPPLLWIFTMG